MAHDLTDLYELAYARGGSPPLADLAKRSRVHRTTLNRWKLREREPAGKDLIRVLAALGFGLALVVLGEPDKKAEPAP